MAVVMTDYSLHQIWLYPQVDAYFMATESMKEEIEKRGLKPQLAVASGIPVSMELREMLPKGGLKVSAFHRKEKRCF